jgi:2,4-dienoyl-CoA reductase-like NADH-dependent reductase (Old Yellow Enzyme family)/thioredoxin reductase
MKELFEPTGLGPLTLKNRLVMTAMSTGFATATGEVTQRLREYYAARAAGGAALLTVEESCLHPQLPHVKNALGIYSDHLIAGLRELTDRIHQEGALAALQLGLYFRQALNGFPRYAVSADAPDCRPSCLELTPWEIHFLVELFVKGAARAQAAGFDALEIHACHGCLLSEFLSPFWNRRTDAYGGERAGRFRFPLEILAAIRKRLGPTYPVLYRISGSEFTPAGFTPEDAVAFSLALEDGGVTAINVSGGLGHVNHVAIPPSNVPRGLLLPLGQAIKDAVRVPVIVGNSMTPELAVQALRSSQADLIGLGRPLIADPQWPLKVKQGRLADIRACLRCNQGCIGGLRDPRQLGVGCIYNPLVGRESENLLTPARDPKRVVVVGGGPAGCEAARVARLRGHEVILLEKQARLGGQFSLAAVPPGKSDYRKLVEFYQNDLERLGVEVRLQTAAHPDLLRSLAADVTVLATGALPARPAIPGCDLPHVATSHAVLAGVTSIQEGPVVVIGGGATGLETASLLAERDFQITVVEMLDAPGRDLIPGIGVREALLARLAAADVKILTGHCAQAIQADAVVVSDRPLLGGGHETRIPAAAVVLALGLKPQNPLADRSLMDHGRCYLIGDCRTPGNAFDAVHQAFELALRI